MNKINLGVFSELANNKADRDLRNVDLNKTDIIIEYQEPTAENNYTWYRLYATGWVEQGCTQPQYSGGGDVTLLIPMQDANTYSVFLNQLTTSASTTYRATRTDNSHFHIYSDRSVIWQVSGKVDPTVMLNHEILPSKAKSEEFEHRVIAFQKPTAENNYTWYRKYADGWVEQGGCYNSASGTVTVSFPVQMADNNYTILKTMQTDSTLQPARYFDFSFANKTTTNAQTNSANAGFSWQVSGMYATEE